MARINYFTGILFFAFILNIQVSGQSSKAYDEEIGLIIRKIQQYPGRTRDLGRLKENFDIAARLDSNDVHSLLKTGQPDIWTEICKIYSRMDARQRKVQDIPENSLKQSGIQIVDYERSIKDARHKAEAYLKAHGEKMLQSGSQADARMAYFDFMQLAAMDGSYQGIDKFLRKAILIGSSNVEFEFHNRTGKEISPALIDRLTIIIREFKKAKYGQEIPQVTDESFAFILRVILDDVEVGPDQYKEVQYQEERDVYHDGIVVDTIKCLITETRQLKKAMLGGSLEYVDKQTGQVVNKIPLKVESVFRNSYASLQGNPEAAGEETTRLLKAGKAEYPSSDQMIGDALREFTDKARQIILSE